MVRVDLPAQRRQEDESKRELQLTCMRNLLSATAARLYFKDLQNRFLLVSAGWIAAYAPGRAAEDLIGKTDFDVFSDEHASAASRDEQRVISTGESIVGKVELETYGGRTDTWVSTTKMPLRDSRDRIIGTFGISRDVTAQTRAENTLAEQALQLIAQNERLREVDRRGVPILGMAFTAHETAYREKAVAMIPEFYGDLEYDGDGNLILSRVHDAVDPAQATARVLRVLRERVVRTTSGRDIPVRAATVCVHSDTPAAPAIAAALAQALRQFPD